MNIVAEIVRAGMESRGLSKADLAHKCNLPISRIGELISEDGDPLPSDIVKALNALESPAAVVADALATQFQRNMPRFESEMVTADRMWKWRTAAQLSKLQLAELSGMHYNTIYQYEKGSRKPTFAVRKKIFALCKEYAENLGIELEW